MTQNNYLSVRHANFWRLVYLVVFLPLEKSFQQKHLNFSERQRCWKKFILKLQENEDINFLPFLQHYTELTQQTWKCDLKTWPWRKYAQNLSSLLTYRWKKTQSVTHKYTYTHIHICTYIHIYTQIHIYLMQPLDFIFWNLLFPSDWKLST